MTDRKNGETEPPHLNWSTALQASARLAAIDRFKPRTAVAGRTDWSLFYAVSPVLAFEIPR